jgi:hypothetical protein
MRMTALKLRANSLFIGMLGRLVQISIGLYLSWPEYLSDGVPPASL